MPSADLKSLNGQSVTICYDITGADATKRSLSNLSTATPDQNFAGSRSRAEMQKKGSPEQPTNDTKDIVIKQALQGDGVSQQEENFAWKSQQAGAPPFNRDAHVNGSDKPPQARPRDGTDGARCKEKDEVERVVFIAGLGARGRTEFFQHVVDHLASLMGPNNRSLLSILTFDNRGIGGSTVFKKLSCYSSKIMAYDTLALLDYLKWKKVHIVGMSLGGMIAGKFAAYWPERVASLTLISATKSGWHMVAGISRCPLLATLAGAGPLKQKILANLRFNFSDGYLEDSVDGRKRRCILLENTKRAITEGDTKKFLAEGQPSVGRQGHLMAVAKHRLTHKEMRRIREAHISCHLIVGRYDRLARVSWVLPLARKLAAPLLILDAAHAGIVVEALSSVLANLEATILGNGRTTTEKLKLLSLATNANVLNDHMYAKEFASTFSPGRVSFRTQASSS